MTFVDAKVEVQGTSLVVMDKDSGDCLVLRRNDPFVYSDERLESIFGPEVFDE